MRKFTLQVKTLLLTALAFFFLATPTKACIDFHTTVFITCHYDTTNWTDISVTVSNLRLFGGNPNDFCSCGITNYTDVFSNIQYVAFVDSGTTNPVAGFDVFNADANSSSAWESVLATGDWSGFVSSVNGNGLTGSAPVELIIRASLPMGYTFTLLDSNLQVTQLGTDEWDNANQTLANSHQSISGFWTGGAATFIAEDPANGYFQDLDNAILLSTEGPAVPSYLKIGPVPATDRLFIHLENPSLSLLNAAVYNVEGRLVGNVPLDAIRSGKTEVDVSAYPEGVYFIKLKTEKGEQTEKFVIQH